MKKDTHYFTHDYNTRSDEKIKCLLRKHGMVGYGIFWSIVEDLYNNENKLQTDYEGISLDLHCDIKLVKSVINDFRLFIVDDEYFCSESVNDRLNERIERSIKARESALKKWGKDNNPNPRPY